MIDMFRKGHSTPHLQILEHPYPFHKDYSDIQGHTLKKNEKVHMSSVS